VTILFVALSAPLWASSSFLGFDVSGGIGTSGASVTNNLSFRIGLGGGISHNQVPESGANSAVETTTPSFNGFAGIRGYFL
jgi:hypothetical protein